MAGIYQSILAQKRQAKNPRTLPTDPSTPTDPTLVAVASTIQFNSLQYSYSHLITEPQTTPIIPWTDQLRLSFKMVKAIIVAESKPLPGTIIRPQRACTTLEAMGDVLATNVRGTTAVADVYNWIRNGSSIKNEVYSNLTIEQYLAVARYTGPPFTTFTLSKFKRLFAPKHILTILEARYLIMLRAYQSQQLSVASFNTAMIHAVFTMARQQNITQDGLAKRLVILQGEFNMSKIEIQDTDVSSLWNLLKVHYKVTSDIDDVLKSLFDVVKEYQSVVLSPLLQQTAFRGMGPLKFITDAVMEHPTFPWSSLSRACKAIRTEFDDFLKYMNIIDESCYAGLVFPGNSSLLRNLSYLAVQLLIKASGKNTLDRYRGIGGPTNTIVIPLKPTLNIWIDLYIKNQMTTGAIYPIDDLTGLTDKNVLETMRKYLATAPVDTKTPTPDEPDNRGDDDDHSAGGGPPPRGGPPHRDQPQNEDGDDHPPDEQPPITEEDLINREMIQLEREDDQEMDVSRAMEDDQETPRDEGPDQGHKRTREEILTDESDKTSGKKGRKTIPKKKESEHTSSEEESDSDSVDSVSDKRTSAQRHQDRAREDDQTLTTLTLPETFKDVPERKTTVVRGRLVKKSILPPIEAMGLRPRHPRSNSVSSVRSTRSGQGSSRDQPPTPRKARSRIPPTSNLDEETPLKIRYDIAMKTIVIEDQPYIFLSDDQCDSMIKDFFKLEEAVKRRDQKKIQESHWSTLLSKEMMLWIIAKLNRVPGLDYRVIDPSFVYHEVPPTSSLPDDPMFSDSEHL